LGNDKFRVLSNWKKYIDGGIEMTKNRDVMQLARAAVLGAIALILPYFFHGINNAGSIFLPMHIPILIAGFLLEPKYSVMAGAAAPILSFLFTGMPPVPYLYVMVLELAAYGLLISVFYNKLKLRMYMSLILGMLGGRIVSIIGTFLILHIIMARPFDFITVVSGLFITGIPGIIIQLVFIPIVVSVLEKNVLKAGIKNGR
jgi:thiamine transporter ThiT